MPPDPSPGLRRPGLAVFAAEFLLLAVCFAALFAYADGQWNDTWRFLREWVRLPW